MDDLRAAIGPPPPDFANAARVLGIDEDRIRAAIRRARSNAGNRRTTASVDAPPPGTIRVTLLGTGGGPGGGGPGMIAERMNATTLVEANGKLLVFDAGRGLVIRLSELGPGYLPNADKNFLTHLHSDHTTDLPDLFITGWKFGRRAPLRV